MIRPVWNNFFSGIIYSISCSNYSIFGIFYSKPERDRWNNKAIPGYSSSGKKCIMIFCSYGFSCSLYAVFHAQNTHGHAKSSGRCCQGWG
jgi:hypothetical protein